jgi:acetyl-CoA acetyltransferase
MSEAYIIDTVRSTIPVVDDDCKVILDHEEYPRPNTTKADLAGLKPAFAQIADMVADEEGDTFRKLINLRHSDLKIEAFHHAGNSSGVERRDLKRALVTMCAAGGMVPALLVERVDREA